MIPYMYFVAFAVLALTVAYMLYIYGQSSNSKDEGDRRLFGTLLPAKDKDSPAFEATCECGKLVSVQIDRFADKRYVRWIISTTGLHYTKEGLQDFVEDHARTFCDDVQQILTDAFKCNYCNLKRIGKTNFKCQNNICDKLKAKLQTCSRHINWQDINWQLVTSPKSLLSNVYLPKASKASYTGPASVDISALLHLMDGCIYIRGELGDPDTIQQVRESRNEIIHSSDMTVTEQDLTRHLTNCIKLLESTPQKYNACKEAIEKIRKIRTSEDKSDVLKVAETKALADLHQANSAILEEIRQEIPSASGEQLKQLKEQLRQQEIKEAKLEGKLEIYNVDTTDIVRRKTEAKELYTKTEIKQEELNAFTKLLENTTVNEEETLTLECQLSKPGRVVQWEKNGQQIVTDEHIKISADIHKHQLIITDVRLTDAGKYRCDCGDVSTDCILDVKELPTEIKTELHDVNIKENETLNIVCQLSRPNKRVRWLKDGTQLTTNDDLKITMDSDTHTIAIDAVTVEDDGQYSCVCGDVISECIVRVAELAPVFIKNLKNQTVEESVPVTLECILSKPSNHVQWMRNGQLVQIPHDRIEITVSKNTHRLSINCVIPEDAGTFKCVCGNASTECTLAMKAKFVKPLEDTHGYTDSSISTVLSCELDQPHRNVTWSKDNQVVTGGEDLTILSGICTHQLLFSKLTNREAGKYTCSCEDTSTTATLTVQDNDDQAARNLNLIGDSAEDVREDVRERSAALQQLRLAFVDLTSLGDQLPDVLTLQHLVKLTLGACSGRGGLELSHEQCQNLGRYLRGSLQLRELKLSVTCTTHGKKSGCGELDLCGQIRLHDITLERYPFTRVVFNPELLLRCRIRLPDNVAGQVSALQNLLAASNLQTLTYGDEYDSMLHVNDTAVIKTLVRVLSQLRGLQQLSLLGLDFRSVTDIRLSATMDQLESVKLYECKFDSAGLECLLQQHNLPQRRVKITLKYVAITGAEDVISKIRQSPDFEEDKGVEYINGEWKVGNFTFYTRKLSR